ncbi:MAG: GGDEF domain-containing protein [Acidimicrobiales bacterium]
MENLLLDDPMPENARLDGLMTDDLGSEELTIDNPEPEEAPATTSGPGPETGQSGGVVNLIRVAKTRCGAQVAFVALRAPDGNFTVVVEPNQAPDTRWTRTAIDELASRIWQDPDLAGIRVFAGKERAYTMTRSGFNYSAKLAVAPLGVVAGDEEVSGLLCVAEPADGGFEQSQLDLLETIAFRLTSYLQARQEIIRGDDEVNASASDKVVSQSVGSGLDSQLSSVDLTAKDLKAEDLTTEVPSGEIRPAGALTVEDPQRERSDLDQLRQPGDQHHAGTESPRPESKDADRFAAPGIGLLTSELLPDPATGLPGLPSMLGRLGSEVGGLGGSDGSVVLVVINIADRGFDRSAISDSLLAKVAVCLREQVRGADQVGRIGASTFSVIVRTGAGSPDPSIFADRIGDALRAMTAISSEDCAVRSVAASATSERQTGPEDLLRITIAQLEHREWQIH